MGLFGDLHIDYRQHEPAVLDQFHVRQRSRQWQLRHHHLQRDHQQHCLRQRTDSFTNVPFNLAVTLTDIKATGSSSSSAVTSGVVNFSGLFNATNVTSKSLLPGVNTWTSPISGSLVLGANDTGWSNYNIQIVSFTPPGQPGGAPGSIEAVVTITPANGPGGSGETGGPSGTPEPTSLVLAGLGLPLIVMVRRRLKKA